MGSETLSSKHATSGWAMPQRQQHRWKGKERAIYPELDSRDDYEGTGAEGGVVVSLELVGDGVYEA